MTKTKDSPGGYAVLGARKVALLTLQDLDGRSNAAKGARATLDALVAELGGAERVSTPQRVLATRCAIAVAMIEDIETRALQGDPVDLATWSTLANSLCRMLAQLGIRAIPVDTTPDLHKYIAAVAEHDAAAAVPPCPVAAP